MYIDIEGIDIDKLNVDEEIDFVDPNSKLDNTTGFVTGFPCTNDAAIQEIAQQSFAIPTMQAEANKQLRMDSQLTQEVQLLQPEEIDPELLTQETVEEFLEMTKEFEEENKMAFSLDEIELLFAQYVRYLTECKGAMIQYKNKTKEIFDRTIKNYAASYRKPWEMVLSFGVAAVYGMSAIASFKAGSQPSVRDTFIAGCSSLAGGGNAVSQWLTNKSSGEKTKLQLQSEAQRTNLEDTNSATRTLPQKQEEVLQKGSQVIQATADAARQILQAG